MKSFTSVKPRHIGNTNGMCGTQKSPLLQACEYPLVKEFEGIVANLGRDI